MFGGGGKINMALKRRDIIKIHPLPTPAIDDAERGVFSCCYEVLTFEIQQLSLALRISGAQARPLISARLEAHLQLRAAILDIQRFVPDLPLAEVERWLDENALQENG